MKCKLKLFLIAVLTTYSVIYSQNINDALNYSSNSYQGTARFNSMSGAFGALGGDLSAIAINPASSAILNDGHFSLSFGSDNKSGEVSMLNASNDFDKNNFTLNQIGGVINFENIDGDNKWKKISIGVSYNQSKNNFNEFSIFNANNNNSIDSYFLNNAEGLRLDQISAFEGESITESTSLPATELIVGTSSSEEIPKVAQVGSSTILKERSNAYSLVTFIDVSVLPETGYFHHLPHP